MRGRLSIVAGLVVGVLAAGLLLGGIVALVPDGSAPTSPTPSLGGVSPGPSISASPTPTARSSDSPPPSSAAFRVGQPAPSLVLPQVAGGTMVEGLKTILPGVDVTP